MKTLLKLSFLFFLFVSAPVFSQEGGSDAKTENKNDVENAKLRRKKDKAEWKARREKEHSEKNAVRNHEKRLQTKETRKRMRRDRAKANRTNQNKKEFFLIRLFKPKPKTGAW